MTSDFRDSPFDAPPGQPGGVAPSATPGLPPPPTTPPTGYTPSGFPSARPPAPGAAGAAPPGYVAFGDSSPVMGMAQHTATFRWLAIGFMWAATAAAGWSYLAAAARRDVFDDPTASFGAFLDADDRVETSALIYSVLAIITAIWLAIWASRAVSNVRLLGERESSPGWAAGGWFIPVGNAFVPFNHLRRSVKFVSGPTAALTVWQVAWAIMVVFGIVTRGTPEPQTASDVSGFIDSQVNYTAASFLFAFVAGIGATVFMLGLDKAASARRADAAAQA